MDLFDDAVAAYLVLSPLAIVLGAGLGLALWRFRQRVSN